TVNFTDLANKEQKFGALKFAEPRVLTMEAEELEEQAEPTSFQAQSEGPPSFVPYVAGPSPSVTFQGLDDIAMADANFIIIPPDVSGGVGPTKVMCAFNNNYRVQDKCTGATLLTLGTATFWSPVITDKILLHSLTDPRTVYDPINNRWIVGMQTVGVGG